MDQMLNANAFTAICNLEEAKIPLMIDYLQHLALNYYLKRDSSQKDFVFARLEAQ
jgi:hypothetical protein